METIRDRILEVLKSTNTSLTALSSGVPAIQVKLSRQLNQGANLSNEIVMLILQKFPQISSEWLLRGVGNMYNNVPKDAEQTDEINRLKDEILDLQREVIRLQREFMDMHSADSGKKRSASS